MAWIIRFTQRQFLASQPHRLDRLLAARVERLGLAGFQRDHERRLWIAFLFALGDRLHETDARKEGGQPPVILLTPFLEWMMMALRTADPLAQEQLRHVFE